MAFSITKMKKIAPFVLLVFFALLLSTGKYAYAVTDGVKLWAGYVLPSFLPYLFITAILSSLSVTFKIFGKFSFITRKLFNVNGCAGYAFFMSAISGYPTGALVTANLKESGLLSENEAETCAILSSTSSPAFTIGVVGNLMFKNAMFGVLLYAANIICAIITGMIFRRKENRNDKTSLPVLKTETKSFYDVTYSSVISVLVVGGVIAVFYVLSEILFSLKILSPAVSLFSFLFQNETLGTGFTFGLLEFTRGLKIIGEVKISYLSLPLAAFLCGFSGLSAILQSLAYLKRAKIKTARFLLSKTVHAVLSFLLSLIFSLFL